MLIRVDGATHVGLVRERNEDALLVDTFVSAARSGTIVTDLEPTVIRVVAVIDGMGGHAAGDRASRLVAHHLADATAGLREADAIGDAVIAAHRLVLREADEVPSARSMGATVAGLAIEPSGRAIAFNLGDSRGYELIDGCLVPVTTDDSPPRPPGMPADANLVMVTQAIGAGRAADPVPHLREVRLDPGSRYLLCSDGLTDYASLDWIEESLGRVEVRSSDLCQLALDGGGGDNVTVALVEGR